MGLCRILTRQGRELNEGRKEGTEDRGRQGVRAVV
jgi:hypothetical protein